MFALAGAYLLFNAHGSIYYISYHITSYHITSERKMFYAANISSIIRSTRENSYMMRSRYDFYWRKLWVVPNSSTKGGEKQHSPIVVSTAAFKWNDESVRTGETQNPTASYAFNLIHCRWISSANDIPSQVVCCITLLHHMSKDQVINLWGYRYKTQN